ncbi:oligogalacturonate lyase family protein [Paraburkholderia caballeronis]|uniref:oligogalacturonate lyase family protein n=1 Tax=Paraburkholderia caballeronis TaxID=416943 RepID=UPI001066D74A|nr:oligogalacturonate lyase family protein [Paraburkholderia caballeronis]TDV19629.1 oligogalacturonide lyase [Paraburkholderia caballeronis]TDV22228.1 oligogalacturonide lyase [Paraburkholderia caballeronis]TDV29132.1 oligogalacturonide lyase [Paraburkholderia caballeronis]
MTFRLYLHRFLACLALLTLSAVAVAGDAPPRSWIDPDTGHRVIRLTDEPGSGSLYFNINAFTPDGKQMVYTTPDRGIAVLDLTTFTSRPLVKGPVGGGPGAVVVGRRTPTVYYFKGSPDDPLYASLWAADIGTGKQRKIADLPRRSGIFSINADETLGVGSYIVGEGEDYNGRQAGQAAQAHGINEPLDKKAKMARRLAARLPMIVFTVDLHTGQTKPVLASTDWIDHLQFSPTDPTLLMYAHQGAWQQVEKLWTIRTDGSDNRHIDPRIMEMEGVGHQWWDDNGNIWYDLHFPEGVDAFVASYNVENGKRIWYHYEQQESSIHFNRSADGTLFAGDGSAAPGAKWIYLFRPERVQDDHSLGEHLIQPGRLKAERLVNMSTHNYHLEPNVRFTPDGKYVIFRSNMFGPTYVFAVEVDRADGAAAAR